MHQRITEDILSKYDINAVIHAFVSLKLTKVRTIILKYLNQSHQNIIYS